MKKFVQVLVREVAYAAKCVGFGFFAAPVACVTGLISASILLLSPLPLFGLLLYNIFLMALPAPVTLIILPLAKFALRGDGVGSRWAIVIVGFLAGGLELLIGFLTEPVPGMDSWLRLAIILSGSIAGAVAGFGFANLVKWRRIPINHAAD